ncbi:hypothetical protein [Streptomyces sp. bgisy084]
MAVPGPDETALLSADVFEAAGALRRLGEQTAGAVASALGDE